MCDCIEFLSNHGLQHFDTLRYVGDINVVNELKAKYDAEFGGKISKKSDEVSILNQESWVSVRDVGLLLIEFLKGIEGGLVSPKIAEEFKETQGHPQFL